MNLAACPVLDLDRAQTFRRILIVFVMLLLLLFCRLVLSISSLFLLLISLLLSFYQTRLASSSSPFPLRVSIIMRSGQQGGVAWLPRRCFRGAA